MPNTPNWISPKPNKLPILDRYTSVEKITYKLKIIWIISLYKGRIDLKSSVGTTIIEV